VPECVCGGEAKKIPGGQLPSYFPRLWFSVNTKLVTAANTAVSKVL